MRRTITTTTAATALLLALAACSNGKSASSTDKAAEPAKSAAAAGGNLTAHDAFAKLSGRVRTAKLSGTVTAADDPNHLLGRPGQYTSKITFNDSRIPAGQVSGTDQGDVERGGAIEAFATAADAQTRAKYVEAVTKSMPALAEYDYVHGTVLVRVSHYLTPKQAAGYETATNGLG
ncbi:hypothetical protein [Streptomyces sp. NPDC046759]|uniref:hypothetical protein n=1 Tax=Streptomyces sp. NPDC046759 TaxID=3155019 RepID=UPI0033DFD073